MLSAPPPCIPRQRPHPIACLRASRRPVGRLVIELLRSTRRRTLGLLVGHRRHLGQIRAHHLSSATPREPARDDAHTRAESPADARSLRTAVRDLDPQEASSSHVAHDAFLSRPRLEAPPCAKDSTSLGQRLVHVRHPGFGGPLDRATSGRSRRAPGPGREAPPAYRRDGFPRT